MLRRVELWDDDLVIPPALAARAAVLALGDELIDLELPSESDSQWLKRGRDLAAAHLLPRAEAALCQELQRLADAVKRAREGQSSSESVGGVVPWEWSSVYVADDHRRQLAVTAQDHDAGLPHRVPGRRRLILGAMCGVGPGA